MNPNKKKNEKSMCIYRNINNNGRNNDANTNQSTQQAKVLQQKQQSYAVALLWFSFFSVVLLFRSAHLRFCIHLQPRRNGPFAFCWKLIMYKIKSLEVVIRAGIRLGFRVYGLEFRVQGLVQGVGVRDSGLRATGSTHIRGLGFRV